MADFGLTTSAVTTASFPLTGNEAVAFDAQLSQGLNPNMVAISTSQIRGYERPAVALTDAATIATDASLANMFTVTLAGNRTLATPTNLQSGGSIYFEVVQDSTGARTLTYGTAFKFSGGTNTLTTTASAIDTIACRYDGTILLCNLATKYS